MWRIVRELVAEGVTVFLTTQHLEEADQLADRIAVLDHGRVVVEGTPEELKRRIPGGHLLLRFTDPGALHAAAAALDAARRDDVSLTLQVPSDGDVASLRAVLTTLDRVRAEPDHLTIHTPDLDDVFFAFTGASATTDVTSEESR
jgi:ABC-2 type transport system ATP-binding protein